MVCSSSVPPPSWQEVPRTLLAQDAPSTATNSWPSAWCPLLGMGGAHIAAVSDVTSGYWNPAGLLNVRGDARVGAITRQYFAGIARVRLRGHRQTHRFR